MLRLPELGLANILLKNAWVPPFKYFRNVGLDHPHPPNENLDRSWHFEFKLVWTNPVPRLMWDLVYGD